MSVAPVWIIKQSSSRYQWIQSHDFVIPIYHDGKIYWWRGSIKLEKLRKKLEGGGKLSNTNMSLCGKFHWGLFLLSTLYFASEFQCSVRVELSEHNLAMLVYSEPLIVRLRIYKRQHISGRESDINDGLLPSTTSTTSRVRQHHWSRGAQWRTN